MIQCPQRRISQLLTHFRDRHPLTEVRAAYTELAKGHTRGKIVLIP
jgi:hypothetical protein